MTERGMCLAALVITGSVATGWVDVVLTLGAPENGFWTGSMILGTRGMPWGDMPVNGPEGETTGGLEMFM